MLRLRGRSGLGTMLNERPIHQLETPSERYDLQFFKQGRMPVSKSDGGNVGLVDIIPSRTGHVPMMTQPVFLDLHLPSTLKYRVSR